MLIVADENIPYAEAILGRGMDAEGGRIEIRLASGRSITPELVREADALVVRSVTRVDGALLEGSRVRFVGTATAGTDHIDRAWLAARGIGFASAAGSNAESVAQYVAAALAFTAGRLGRRLEGATLGIIGVGRIGTRVARVAGALGMRVVLNDPPRARAAAADESSNAGDRATGDKLLDFRPLDEALACDYVTLHVPLHRGGEDNTVHLIGESELARLRPEAVLINAARGPVVDNAALRRALAAGRLAAAVLDVWEGEPRPDRALAALAALATPHIAGYSHDGKVAGTLMIDTALRRHFGLIDTEQGATQGARPCEAGLALPEAAAPRLALGVTRREFESVAAELLLTAYPIWRDDFDFRRACGSASASAPAPSASEEDWGVRFDRLRRDYPLRREFAATRVALEGAPREWLDRLRGLGFSIEQ